MSLCGNSAEIDTLACGARCDRAASPWCQIQRRKGSRSRSQRNEFRLSRSDRCCLSASNTSSTFTASMELCFVWAATKTCHNIILSRHTTHSSPGWLSIPFDIYLFRLSVNRPPRAARFRRVFRSGSVEVDLESSYKFTAIFPTNFHDINPLRSPTTFKVSNLSTGTSLSFERGGIYSLKKGLQKASR